MSGLPEPAVETYLEAFVLRRILAGADAVVYIDSGNDLMIDGRTHLTQDEGDLVYRLLGRLGNAGHSDERPDVPA